MVGSQSGITPGNHRHLPADFSSDHIAATLTDLLARWDNKASQNNGHLITPAATRIWSPWSGHEPRTQAGPLTSGDIIEAIEDGRIKIIVPPEVSIWNPPWRNPMRYGEHFLDMNSLEYHLDRVIHLAPRPRLMQQVLQFAVRNLGWEWLRPTLRRYASNWTTNCPTKMQARYRKVVLTRESPTFLQLPGEFVLTHSAQIIGLAVKRRREFGNKPLLGMKVGGLSWQDRLGMTNNLGADWIKPEAKPRTHTDERAHLGTMPYEWILGGPAGQFFFFPLPRTPQPVNGYFDGQMHGKGNGVQVQTDNGDGYAYFKAGAGFRTRRDGTMTDFGMCEPVVLDGASL
jgi:hypothetical protein